ncbi:hypothetical protein KUV57_12900 [Epibacterium sp. DP7N7-1]|nr:hypothetical protein [Epibacterium sp. DP7N7-1]
MSNKNKTTAHLQTDSGTGIVLAHTAHADGVEARREELTDGKSISKAQEELGFLENRINHLSGLSNIFDDEDEGPITTGEIIPATTQTSEVDVSTSSLNAEDDDALGMEEELVIGGLSEEGEDDLLGNVIPESDLMAPFDDDEISGAVEDVQPETEGYDEDLTFFQTADEVELEHNREISEATQADADDTGADDLSFLHDDGEPEMDEGHYVEEGTAADTVGITTTADEDFEENAPQSLTTLVSHRVTSVEDVSDVPDAIASENSDGEQDADTDPDEANTTESSTSFDEMPVPDWASTDDGFTIPGDTPVTVDEGEDLLTWNTEETSEPSEPDVTDENSVDFSDVTVFDTVEEDDTPGYATDVADYRDGTEGPDANSGILDHSLEEGEAGVSENAKNDISEGDLLSDVGTTSSEDTGWLDTDENDTAQTSEPEAISEASADPEASTEDDEPVKKRSLKALYVSAAVTAILVSAGGFFAMQKLALTPDTTTAVNQPAISTPIGLATDPAQDGFSVNDVMDADAATKADEEFKQDIGDVSVDPMAIPDEISPVTDEVEDLPLDISTDLEPINEYGENPIVDELDDRADEGSISDLVLDEDFTGAVSDELDGIDHPDETYNVSENLADAASGDIDSLFIEDKPDLEDPLSGVEDAPEVTKEMLDGLASQDDVDEIREAIDLMFDKVETMSDEIVERDQAIVDLQSRLANAEARAQRAETLALGQNEVLAEFLRVKEKVDMAENLIVDLSRRTAAMETTDPADRVAVDRSINDLNERLEGVARDLGLIARVAINGSPDRAKTRSNPGAPDVPGAGAVYEQSAGGIAAPGEAAQIPSDVKVGDFVEGYGYVLQIMPTSDGARVVVMENKSVLIP